MGFPFTQLLVNSLIIGSIYALVAVGFSLIYQTNRIMHFAHGAVVVLGAYMAFLFFTLLGLPFTLAVIITLAIGGIVGYLMYKGVYFPLQKRKASMVIMLIASFALLILIENLILIGFGSDIKVLGLIETSQGMSVLGATITPLQIVIIVASLVIMLLTYLFTAKTKIGRQMRAVSDNSELADIMGINSKYYMALAFVLGSILASVAGILVGLEQQLSTAMGTNLMIKGFSGAVIGGITSVPASILGSFIVGIAENFGIWWLPSGFKDAITFVLLFIFLLVKPNGLFGISRGGRK